MKVNTKYCNLIFCCDVHCGSPFIMLTNDLLDHYRVHSRLLNYKNMIVDNLVFCYDIFCCGSTCIMLTNAVCLVCISTLNYKNMIVVNLVFCYDVFCCGSTCIMLTNASVVCISTIRLCFNLAIKQMVP